MASLAREFNQVNLVPITKQEYREIRTAIDNCRLLEFSKNAWIGGNKAGWIMKTEPTPEGVYLLVEHYESKGDGTGLRVVHKADCELYETYKGLLSH